MEVTTEQHVAQTSFSVKSPITIETDVVHVDTGAAGLSQVTDIQSENKRTPKQVHFKMQELDNDNGKKDRGSVLKKIGFKRMNSFPPSFNSIDLSCDEMKLKVSLYYHICNPLKRWKVERVVPYKMILQIIKSIVLLIQVMFFTFMLSNDRAAYSVKSHELFKELFLKNKGSSSKLYTQQELIEEITHSVVQYHQLPNIAIGRYVHQLDSNGDVVLIVKLRQYKQFDIDVNDSITLDGTIETSVVFTNISANETDLFNQFKKGGFDWNRFIEISLLMSFKNFRVVFNRIECYLFMVVINYTNNPHTGLIHINLISDDAVNLPCIIHTNLDTGASISLLVVATVVDVIVIILCTLSIFFSILKYWKAYKLGKAMGKFYNEKLHLKLSWMERRSLFSGWLLFTIISDILLIFGSIIKILMDHDVNISATGIRILLGTAVVVEAGTILRYISFFKQLNALTRTLSYVFPDLMKFLLCVTILFTSFSISSTIIFSPYNERFATINKALESLFVLTNGEDIYPMFQSFDSTSNLAIYIYSQVFIYVFVALFVYAVLNLFTSFIINARKMSQKIDRATINEVRRFIFSGPLTENGGALRDITYVHKYVDPEIILNRDDKFKRKNSYLVDVD